MGPIFGNKPKTPDIPGAEGPHWAKSTENRDYRTTPALQS
jgi:hypothetical protein